MSPLKEDAVIQKALQILRNRVKPDVVLDSPNKSRDYFTLQLAHYEYEVFCVLFLDAQHKIIAMDEMFRGTIDGASVYPREVVKACLSYNASALIFVHNHPSGVCEPSTADLRITERLKSALALIDVRVLDHFIIGGGNSFSFAENGKL